MRLLGQTLFAATAIGLSLVIAPACVDNDQSLYIKQVMAPPTGGDCTFQADPSQPALFEGTMDVALRSSYQAVVLVGNQMIARSDNLGARAESNKAHLDGAIVRITDANGNDINEFTAQASGFADASNGTIANFGLMGITLLDPPTLAKINIGTNGTLVLAKVKVFGETLGGVDLESGEFQFGIRVCRGCLVSFTDADDPAVDGVDCNLSVTSTPTGGAAQLELPCFPGQDVSVPCAYCRSDIDECKTRK